jgi:hypothetical protein
MKTGERIRIADLGPNDSYMRDGDSYNMIGQTGTLLEIHDNGIAAPGYVTCLIELDNPLLNYLVRITLFEAKLEPIEGYDRRKEDKDGEGINSGESPKE